MHTYTLTTKKSERELKETIPFTIATKRVKYLGINLPKTKELYTENYKRLMRETKDDTNGGEMIYHVLRLEKSIL